jgi:AraC-like DNA-binding protein
MPVAPLLQHASLFRSECPEETRHFLGAKDHLFALGRAASGLDVRLNGLYLPGLYVGYLSYGDAEVSAASGASHTEYWLHLSVAGGLSARAGACEVVADAGRGMVIAPSQRSWRLTTRPGSARLQIALNRAAMVRCLESLLGDAPAGPLEFSPSVDLVRGWGRSLARYVMLAIRDLEDPGSALTEPATLAAFEEFVMTALLMGQPHSHSAALGRLDRRLAPRDVKRAEAFIREHFHLPIGIADIAAAAGVPGRTLFKHFRDFKGVSPMRHLRDARLARARDALRSPRGGDNVTAVAAACGLAHMGRFSADYRRVYGESPSQTLATARRGRRG